MDQVEAKVSGRVTANREPLDLCVQVEGGGYFEIVRHIGADLFEVKDYDADGYGQRRRLVTADQLAGETVLSPRTIRHAMAGD